MKCQNIIEDKFCMIWSYFMKKVIYQTWQTFLYSSPLHMCLTHIQYFIVNLEVLILKQHPWVGHGFTKCWNLETCMIKSKTISSLKEFVGLTSYESKTLSEIHSMEHPQHYIKSTLPINHVNIKKLPYNWHICSPFNWDLIWETLWKNKRHIGVE